MDSDASDLQCVISDSAVFLFQIPCSPCELQRCRGVTADSIVTMHSSVPRLVVVLVIVSLVTCSDSDGV